MYDETDECGYLREVIDQSGTKPADDYDIVETSACDAYNVEWSDEDGQPHYETIVFVGDEFFRLEPIKVKTKKDILHEYLRENCRPPASYTIERWGDSDGRLFVVCYQHNNANVRENWCVGDDEGCDFVGITKSPIVGG